MNKKEFDNYIAEQLKKKGDALGYKNDQGKQYENYYSNDAFSAFIAEMDEKYHDAFTQYVKGKGGEAKKREVKAGDGTVVMAPPKMASVASSSRFAYLALRDGATCLQLKGKPAFEYGCKIDGMSSVPPQLDACFKDDNTYFEVKCHEIFDSHKVIMSNAYYDAVSKIVACAPSAKIDKREKEFEVSLSAFNLGGQNTSRFDIKQLLCHLMGVASQEGDNKTLYYLFFLPDYCEGKNNELQKVYDELLKEIKAIFSSEPIKKYTIDHNITLKAIAEISSTMEALTSENYKELFTAPHN